MDKIALIIPTFNHEKYIGSALENLAGQVYDEDKIQIKLIISNDCSIDKTNDVIQEWIPALQEKYWLLYNNIQFNLGIYEHFRYLVEECIPEDCNLVQICEGDDSLHPDSVQKRYNFLKAGKFDAVHSDTNYLYEDGSVIENFWAQKSYPIQSPITEDFLLINNRIMTCSLIMSRGFFVKAYNFPLFQKLGIALCDYAACLRAVRLGCKFGYLPEATATYRILGSSFSHTLPDILGETWKVQDMARSGELYQDL